MSFGLLPRLQRGIDRLRPESRTARAMGLIGLSGILAFLVVGFAAPLASPFGATATPGDPFEAPSLEHPLGTDDVGHDLFTLLMLGARVSLLVGLLGGALAIGLGTLVGIGAGLLDGPVGNGLMRVVDVALTLPFLPLIIVATAFAGPGLGTTVVVLGSVLWAQPARELRSQVLSVKEREYVQASKAMGASTLRLGIRHVLPAVSPIVVAQFAKAAGTAILLEASLSFLGLGDPTTPSWGTILFFAQQRSAFLTDAWLWWVVPPGLAISASVLCFVFLGFAVEDVAQADPRVGPTRPGDAPELVTGGASGDVGAGVVRAEEVTVRYDGAGTPAVDDVDLPVRPDEVLGVVGGSGSGKSSLALSLVGLLPPAGRVETGRLVLGSRDDPGPEGLDLADLRGRRIGLVPQEAMNALNPLMSARAQVTEALVAHDACPGPDADREARELLEQVGLPGESHDRYPHELSGGMRQRAAVAVALAAGPDVLIADEPTTGLDTVTKGEILDLLDRLQDERGFALVIVSHDLPAVTAVADHVAVMRDGDLVETLDLTCQQPRTADPHTRALLDARTRIRRQGDRSSWPSSSEQGEALLRIEDLAKRFPEPGSPGGVNRVLEEVSLTVHRGEVVGLIGESGVGKSTIGRVLAGLVRPDGGTVEIEDHRLEDLTDDRRALGRRVHYLFQDPYGSLPPSARVRSIVREPLEIHDVPADQRDEAVIEEALEAVELVPSETFVDRYPGQLSGGERQRVALARALVLQPSLLVADEPASMLDAPLKAGLLERIRALADERGLATLLITHDIARAAAVADRLLVLHDGHVVEAGPAQEVVASPDHPETQRLVAAATRLDGAADGRPLPYPQTGGAKHAD